MTLADFWGIEDIVPEMNDGKGTSLVIARTDKGQDMFNSIKDKLKWREVSYEDAVKFNTAEYMSVKRPSERNDFFIDLNSMPFEEIIKKYVEDKRPSGLKYKIKRLLKIGGGKKLINDYGVLFTFKNR